MFRIRNNKKLKYICINKTDNNWLQDILIFQNCSFIKKKKKRIGKIENVGILLSTVRIMMNLNTFVHSPYNDELKYFCLQSV
jgi:hypothetical protein